MRTQPEERHYTVRGLDLAVWDWAGEGQPVVLCHATGFHGRCWDQIVERLPGRRCIAVDFRGHGRSEGMEPPCHWREFGADLSALAGAMGIAEAIGVGHSMGGHALTLACSLNARLFASLLLLDPVILPEASYTGATEPLDFVLRRRNVWASADEMFARFKDRPPFESWDPAVLRDYCDYALKGQSLACRPAVEASIYANSVARESNIYAEIEAVDIPVQVVRSKLPYSYGRFDGSPTAPGLASRFRHGSDRHLTTVSHFIPMEGPALTAELILSL